MKLSIDSKRSRAAHSALICAAAMLFACGEDATGVDPWEPAYVLEGTWQWVSSLDLSSDELHTPESTGDEASLTFEASSSHSGTFVYSVTGEEDVHGDFGIATEDSAGPAFIAIEPGIAFLASHAWIAVDAERLLLSGSTSPRYESTYVRVPG